MHRADLRCRSFVRCAMPHASPAGQDRAGDEKAEAYVLTAARADNGPTVGSTGPRSDNRSHDSPAEHGIDVVQHAPQVGKNLIDHLWVPLGFDVPQDTFFAAEKPLQLVNYLVRGRGMLTSNGAEAYGSVRSRPDLKVPDLELMFAPGPYFDEAIGDPYQGHAVTYGSILLRPHSRALRSRDPKDKPIIDAACAPRPQRNASSGQPCDSSSLPARFRATGL